MNQKHWPAKRGSGANAPGRSTMSTCELLRHSPGEQEQSRQEVTHFIPDIDRTTGFALILICGRQSPGTPPSRSLPRAHILLFNLSKRGVSPKHPLSYSPFVISSTNHGPSGSDLHSENLFWLASKRAGGARRRCNNSALQLFRIQADEPLCGPNAGCDNTLMAEHSAESR